MPVPLSTVPHQVATLYHTKQPVYHTLELAARRFDPFIPCLPLHRATATDCFLRQLFCPPPRLLHAGRGKNVEFTRNRLQRPAWSIRGALVKPLFNITDITGMGTSWPQLVVHKRCRCWFGSFGTFAQSGVLESSWTRKIVEFCIGLYIVFVDLKLASIATISRLNLMIQTLHNGNIFKCDSIS